MYHSDADHDVRDWHAMANDKPELLSQQFGHRPELFNVVGHDFDNDDDRNAQQHPPDSPQPGKE